MASHDENDELRFLHDTLLPILSEAVIGNFDRDIDITVLGAHSRRAEEILLGVQVLLEVIREKTRDMETAQKQLRESRDRSINMLDEVLKKSLD